jgi:hypothetical protein
MARRQKKALKALTFFLVFAFVQVYVQAGLPQPIPGDPQGPRLITARLALKGGTSIVVNGITALNGTTILTGAAIETPDQVSATVDMGALGTLDLAPNSKVQLDFDQNGNVRVKVLQGCVILKKKGAGVAEVYTDQGASEKSDDKNRRRLAFCYAAGGLKQYAAVTAAGGLSKGALAAILIGGGGGTAVAIYFATRGGNPSPSTP